MTTRLRNGRGADEANFDGVSHKFHSDGFFYVPADVAQRLIGGGTGFYRAAPDEHPDAGSVSVEEIADMVFGLEDGPLRAALIQALSAHGAL